MRHEAEIEVKGRRIPVSNLEKIFYPRTGFTKGQVIDYYIRISDVLLPHLKKRPLTLKRYPNGVEQEFFYEKKCPSHRPDWVKTAPVWSEGNQATIQFCLADDLPSLVWAANLADLELHTSLSRYPHIERPTVLVFDLDPGPPATIVECAEVAVRLREKFQNWGLQLFPKTSGSKGLQVYAPLNVPVTYELTKPLAKWIAQQLEKEMPQLVVSKMSKQLRVGKIFVDWSQNDQHKTTVCVYSLRAKDKPTVSTPLTWEEVEAVRKSRNPLDLQFETEQVLQRVEKMGDLFEPVLKLKQKFSKNVLAEMEKTS